jgi:ribosome-binding factor A
MVQKRGRHGSSPARFPRVARVNEVLREIIAVELERIQDDDPRLELVTVTGIDADPDVKHATVYFSSLSSTASTDDVLLALNENRIALQKVVGKNVRFKNTPQLTFKPDLGIVEGQKVEDILRDLRLQSPETDD